jgi:hypothetical protein
MYLIRLSEGISKHQQLKKKSAPTALNTVSPRRTHKPHGATRQQAFAETPAKWSAYQIPSVIVAFVVLVFKVWFVSFYSQKPQEALNLLVTEERYWALFYMPLYTFLHNLLNVPVPTANKMGFKKTIS